jgi:uncharacterized repeat protein (TIGR03803 family)
MWTWPSSRHALARLAVAAMACAFAGLGVSSAQANQYKLRTLYSFCSEFSCADGFSPTSGLVMDSAGDLYGVAAGGTHGGGIAYKLSHVPGRAKWNIKVLYNFCALAGCSDGQVIPGSLVLDVHGNLYGLTSYGGSAGSGTVFELTPGRTGKYDILHTLYSFCSKDSACTDGQDATALTYRGAAAGAPYDGVSPLYGVTLRGGKHFRGVAFSLVPGHPHEHLLYVFCQKAGCSDGALPQTLTFDPAGNLVGVAQLADFRGLIFRLSPVVGQKRWTETTVYTFCALPNCSDGNVPSGAPIFDANGNMFGVTRQGGTAPNCLFFGGCGVIYKIAANNTETVLHNFCARRSCDDGILPTGPLVMDASGNLYGDAEQGGLYGVGTAFEWLGPAFRVRRSFCAEPNCSDGANPKSGLVMNSAGDLFGTTSSGGLQNVGTVFELKP